MTRPFILGAGVAGLTAAYTHQRRGQSNPVVAEKHPYPGGLAATMEWNDCRIDLGPHRLHTVLPRVKELTQDLVGDQLITSERTSQIFLNGKWLDYPPRPGEMLRKLGPGVGLRIALSALGAKGKSLLGKLKSKETHTYADYLEQRFGRYLRDLIFDPFTLKVYREEPEDLDDMIGRVRIASQGVFSVLWEGITGRSKSAVKSFLYPRTGMGLISARLVERIQSDGGEVLLGHEAVRVRHTGGLVRSVELRNPDGESISLEASHLISTIPLTVLMDLLEPKPPAEAKAAAENLVYADSFLVYNLVDKQPLTPNCWMYFPGEEVVFTRVTEFCHFSRDLVPEGQSCLLAEIPLKPSDPLQFAEDEEIKSRVWEGFVKSGMASGANLLDQVILRVPRAYPIYKLGYRKELGKVLDYLSGLGNLVSTGRHGLFHYNNSDHSMEMGRLAAEFAVGSPRESARWYARRDEFDAYRIVD
jgi:protoporphyrinogen oxidase